ncbi:hypothetical protein [Rhizobium rhizogenes]|uniref:hypothetical protein n=1 Tax=Rhizobium rhizogenes TaxID=359 RepID=UPI00080FDC4D|nr:hypothetical protein [Rhizobium rhizogenes]OCJ22342.1 hypothetical protein A6U88_29450 [Agrobacterium sp. B131/95]NTH46631.1 hypothetical protein [Rhizobium rhizogenes]NTH59497.1 hypothetical protein [Rhizobium rhizogenes]NTH90648.1 hypothetical protein [Rhizobium rhizogenes]NTI42824.1 hypothetical protein [Rhizobium rhizogenes]
MSNVTRHALRVYAALSELKGNERDVLDALLPFFDPILTLMNGKIFNPHVFAAGVRRLYRWRFTGDVAEAFIPRLERKGILHRQASTQGGAVWGVRFTPEVSEPSATIVGAFEQIIDEFEKFPPRVTDLLSYQRTRDELEDILIRFLVSMDSYGEGAYMPELGDLEPGGQARELVALLPEGGRPLEANDRYMCARFIQHLMRAKPEFGTHLARLSSIALLTEVVEDFMKPTDVEHHVDLTIALDAPIALDFLGCSGKAFQEDIQAIVKALQSIGVKFIVFPNSCVEMQRNLKSMLSLPPEQRRGYTHNALIKREVSLDYVTAVANGPERALESAGITVRPISLESYRHAHRYFTAEQYEDFFASVTWGNLVAAREHDATCLALVMRLREAQHSSDLFKCRYVMVTRNSTFVRQARRYCLQSRMINEVQEGPIMFQRELATMAWLRTGLGAEEAIPRGHLITACDRVLQMRPEVRNALASQLAKITPERLEQLNLLMQDARSVQKLADQTLNDERAVTADNADHLLQVMREATAEELKEKHQAELDLERDAAQAAKDAADAKITLLSEQLEQMKRDQKAVEDRIEDQLLSIVSGFNTRAARFEWGTLALLILIGFVGCFNFFTHVLDGVFIWNLVAMVIGALGAVRLILAILEKPMPGLKSLITVIAKRYLPKEAARRAIDWSIVERRISLRNSRLVLADRSTDLPTTVDAPSIS